MPQAIVVYTQTAAIISLLLLIINTGIKFGKASACPRDSSVSACAFADMPASTDIWQLQVEEFAFQSQYPFIFNVIIGACCLFVELLCVAEFSRRIYKALCERKIW